MKAFILWMMIVLFGLSTTYLSVQATEADPFIVMQEPVLEIVEHPVLSERVPHDLVQSVVRLRVTITKLLFKPEQAVGSAVIIGRKRITEDMYRYYVLTAYHVIYDAYQNPVEVSQWANAHAKVDIVKDLKLDIHLMIPSNDSAVVSFDIEDTHVWPVVQLATEAEFLSLRTLDIIYGVGCDGGYGPLPRVGNFGLGNLQIEPNLSSKFAFFANPDAFFRPYINSWFGASGGGIFNKDGKLIGLFNGILTSRSGKPARHMIAALKTYIVLDLLQTTGSEELLREDK